MKKVPEFKNEAEEFEFWSTADSTEYVDWSQAKRVKFVNLKAGQAAILSGGNCGASSAVFPVGVQILP
jgi:hypothetical protein